MKHRIGYACINTAVNVSTNKTCRLSNCTSERLRSLINNNLNALKEILLWNISHNIYLYRISSGVIPFATHSVNDIDWVNEFSDLFKEISVLIKKYNMRVSMHPGQFVNINSPNPDIVKSSIAELAWHAEFLDALNVDSTHRLILHVGGVYGDKPSAMSRFIEVYNNLPISIKNRLSLENDDKSYTVWDVLNINKSTNVPIVFDNLHHKVNNTHLPEDENIKDILKACFSTWNEDSGIPKIHFSSQKQGERSGAHAESIDMTDFIAFYKKFKKFDFDIMFETKNKEQSVLEAFRLLQEDAAYGK